MVGVIVGPNTSHICQFLSGPASDHLGSICREWLRIPFLRWVCALPLSCCSVDVPDFLPRLRLFINTKACVVSKSNFCVIAHHLLFNNRIRIGINMCTSAIATDVTRCHVSMAIFTLNFVRKFQEIEGLNVAFFFGANCLLSSRKSFSINSCFFDEFITCLIKGQISA